MVKSLYQNKIRSKGIIQLKEIAEVNIFFKAVTFTMIV
jgi:hypothetical protein